MIAVIFEVQPEIEHNQEYLDIAAQLYSHLIEIDGFISIERFESISNPGKILSLSFWRDEQSIEQWRNSKLHRSAQTIGRMVFFKDYRLRIAEVIRDYGKFAREQAPSDSKHIHG